MKETIRWGVMLGRFQPLHNGHIELIKEILKENDKLLLIIGSANKEGTLRNPFEIELRKEWIDRYLDENGLTGVVRVLELADWNSENELDQARQWGAYFYYNVVASIEQKQFTFYYCDDVNMAVNWFDMDVRKNINVKNLDRTEVAHGVSATKVREAIVKEDFTFVENNCPKFMLGYMYTAKVILDEVIKNPKPDFNMA